MKRGYRLWTPEDDKQLKEIADYFESAKDIAILFNVTVSSIRNRCRKVGIKLQKPIPKRIHDNPLELRNWLWANKISPYLIKNAECLEWNYASYHHGYGQIRVNKKTLLQTHRISFEVKNNVILDSSQLVLHKCDNPRCNNPVHLFLGTQLENVKDMMNKGRGRGQFTKGLIPHNVGYLIFNEKKTTFKELANASGFSIGTIRQRIRSGWTIKNAISIKPVKGNNQLISYKARV